MRPLGPPLIRLPLLVAVADCGDSATAPTGRVVAGVDLDEVFAAPTATEIGAVQSEWAGRSVQVEGVSVVREAQVSLGSTPATVRIVSHRVDDLVHYGAIAVP